MKLSPGEALDAPCVRCLTTRYALVYNRRIMAKKTPSRSKLSGQKRTVVLSIRLTAKEREWIGQAAGPYPVGIWSRIELVELAKARIKRKKKGGRR